MRNGLHVEAIDLFPPGSKASRWTFGAVRHGEPRKEQVLWAPVLQEAANHAGKDGATEPFERSDGNIQRYPLKVTVYGNIIKRSNSS